MNKLMHQVKKGEEWVLAQYQDWLFKGLFLGEQILESGKSLSKWLKNSTEIRDVSGERKTEEDEKSFIHVLFFFTGRKIKNILKDA